MLATLRSEKCKYNWDDDIKMVNSDQWKLEAGKGYFFTRNNSTLVAFNIGHKAASEGVSMFKIVGCHTDSPVLKLSPVSKLNDRAGF